MLLPTVPRAPSMLVLRALDPSLPRYLLTMVVFGAGGSSTKGRAPTPLVPGDGAWFAPDCRCLQPVEACNPTPATLVDGESAAAWQESEGAVVDRAWTSHGRPSKFVDSWH